MEAVNVRVQTQAGFARGLSDGLPKFVRSEGALGLYKVLVPLWARQIPYTMMKFASFENIVEIIYKHVIPRPKSECSKTFQLGVSFAGGYVAGVLCAIVLHPADNLVSFLNNAKGATVGDELNGESMMLSKFLLGCQQLGELLLLLLQLRLLRHRIIRHNSVVRSLRPYFAEGHQIMCYCC
ncbi:mitochondrial carrier protein [Lithospermum erythrorhizon]|uniref:Mitochondrial carrier protein n=1 Tax=Lithospermum erythrorhizon TaxID=34254 RepID=A0AAV3RB12_LITER